MVRMFVRHTVSDFATWKQGYDEFDAQRRSMGVRGDAVFCGADNANDVTIWHDFDDLAAAQAFLGAPGLAEAMEAAGVVSEPQVWYANRDLPS